MSPADEVCKFPPTLELESLWVGVFQKQKNRKKNCMIITSSRSKIKGSCLVKAHAQKQSLCSGSGPTPFFLLLLCFSWSSESSLYLYLLLALLPFCPFMSSLLPVRPSPFTSIPLSSFPYLTFYEVQVVLTLGSRATSLSWWYCESFLLYINLTQLWAEEAPLTRAGWSRESVKQSDAWAKIWAKAAAASEMLWTD